MKLIHSTIKDRTQIIEDNDYALTGWGGGGAPKLLLIA